MANDEIIHACPVHDVSMVPSGEYEAGPIRPASEGRSVAYPILKCPEPGCPEAWTAVPG